MKKLFLMMAWFSLSVGTALTAVAAYQTWFYVSDSGLTTFSSAQPATIASDDQHLEKSSSLPATTTGSVKGISTIQEYEDVRLKVVAHFLKRHNSPLEPYDYYGAKIVEISDRYNIDFRLLPAIAMQESNLCKKTPPGSHNCLGFGIHSAGSLGFESYEAGFERAARELKANYIDKGRVTPELIMAKYTPSSNGSWADSVNQWMAEMRYNDRESGRSKKTNADLLEFVHEDTDEISLSDL